jgi:hypothetical protein
MTQAPTIMSQRRIAMPRNRFSNATIVERTGLRYSQEPIPAQVVAAKWFARFMEEIEQLCQLSRGWDSNGADPPEEPMIMAALEIAASLAMVEWTQPSVITATRSGGIQFEWGQHDKVYFELECISRDTAQYFFSDKALRIEREGTIHSGESLDDVISYILRVRKTS